MDNTLYFTNWTNSPQCWKGFVDYVETIAEPVEWMDSEGGNGSYSYEFIADTLKREWNTMMIYLEDGVRIVFPNSNHKLLFELTYG